MPKEKNTKNKNKEGEQTPQENPVQNEGVPSIAMSIEEYDALQTQLADLKSQSEEYLNGLQRERADFANYKRRIDQESLNTYQNALADIVKVFLSVSDDLDRALANRPGDEVCKPWVDGIELISKKLMRSLVNQGIQKLEVNPGDAFDPNLFEAVTHEEHEDYSNGQVIEVLTPGYKIKERIIRPATVRVAK